MRLPSNSPVTLAFGATSSPYSPGNPHRGVDFAHAPDNIIYAPFAGRVSQIVNNGRDGNGTYMTDSQGRAHGLLHSSKYLVPNGSNVAEGQPIAVMGETGFAQGVHLHWAVKQNGQFIDGTSIISKQELPMLDDTAVRMMVEAFWDDPNLATPAFVNRWVGQPPLTLLATLHGSSEYKNRKESLSKMYTSWRQQQDGQLVAPTDADNKLSQIKKIVN